MTPIRRAELEWRYAYVTALIAKAGSVRQAAKLAGMRRPNFIRLRNNVSQQRDKLTAPAEKRTN